jgi:hypothetical protein
VSLPSAKASLLVRDRGKACSSSWMATSRGVLGWYGRCWKWKALTLVTEKEEGLPPYRPQSNDLNECHDNAEGDVCDEVR